MAKTDLTAQRLRELLNYDSATGTFTRRFTRGRCDRWKAGDQVGHLASSGYVQVCVDGSLWQAHRLVWLIEHGALPAKHIDHIDGNRSNNRLSNLRECDDLLNMQNIRKAHKDNKLGVLGVKAHQNKFLARIFSNGKEKSLGLYATPELAHAAYLEAKRKIHPGCTI